MPQFLHLMFATRNDMEPGLRRVEAAMPVDYVLTGMFDTGQVVRYKSAVDLPNFGVSLTGADTLEPTYMVVPAGAHVEVQPIPQRRGGIKYVVDQRRNPRGSILFSPSGLYRDEALISGDVGTPLRDQVSLDLFRLFYREVFRGQGFVRVNVYHVGPDALGLLREGLRLTDGVKNPRMSDLAIGEVRPIPPTVPGVWGQDSPEILAMRSKVKE